VRIDRADARYGVGSLGGARLLAVALAMNPGPDVGDESEAMHGATERYVFLLLLIIFFSSIDTYVCS
jgi:hypothetical protein